MKRFISKDTIMILTQRLNNTHVLRTYLNMIRTAPLSVVQELKQNLESESIYTNNRYYSDLQKEFEKRLG